MSELALDPTQIEWKGRGGFGRELDYRAKVRDGVLVFKPRIRSLRDLVVWASGKSNDWITKVLNGIWSHSAAVTFPTPLFFALWTATLTAASTGATAGETTYTGYARVSVTANTTNFSTSSGGSATTNNTAITFGADTVGTPTITFVAVCDASTTGNILYWASITSTPIGVGDTPQINAAAMTASEA